MSVPRLKKKTNGAQSSSLRKPLAKASPKEKIPPKRRSNRSHPSEEKEKEVAKD